MSRSRAPRDRRPNQALSRERIAEAALAQISATGRASLSMRNLASALGCEAMSLYHHVDGIEGVLEAVVDLLFGALPQSSPAGADPRRTLEHFALAFLGIAEQYPEAFPLIPGRLFRTPLAVRTVGRSVELLRAMGLTPRTALRHSRILGAYLGGAGLALAAWRTTGAAVLPRMKAAAKGDATLSAMTGHVNPRDVRADLCVGLAQMLDAAASDVR